MRFLTSLHQDSELTKKKIYEIFRSVKENIIDKILTHTQCSDDHSEKISTAYHSLSSHYKFMKKMEVKTDFKGPEKVIVSQKIGKTFKRGELILAPIVETISLQPIKQHLQTFLQSPNVLSTIIANMTTLTNDDESIKNFIQCEVWKNIRANYEKDEIVIPIFLYADEFEPDNPLSSNAGNNKICAFYYSIPVVQQYLLSSPKYIFTALICSAKLKDNHLNLCMKDMIKIFKELETDGLYLNIDGKPTQTFLVLSAVVGDNLAVNELLGFTKSFNANVFCRDCFSPKEITKSEVVLREEYERTIENYDLHITQNDVKTTGIKNVSPLTELSNFHPINNFTHDITHDIFEGIARYDLPLLFKHFIYSKKYFNFQQFNNRKQQFDYQQLEIGNLSNPISEFHLKNENFHLSASEMKTFIFFSTLMYGDLVPGDDVGWKTLKKLVNLCDILIN
jgi:hypothetical protein